MRVLEYFRTLRQTHLTATAYQNVFRLFSAKLIKVLSLNHEKYLSKYLYKVGFQVLNRDNLDAITRK